MTKAEVREWLEALHINMQTLMQLRSKCRHQDPEKDSPIIPHFIVSAAQGPGIVHIHLSF